MEVAFLWVGLSIAAGVFASNYRNRFGLGWFLLSLLISPLLAFVFIAVSKKLPEREP